MGDLMEPRWRTSRSQTILLPTGITSYTASMKTAISLPNEDFERFERVAARHGLNRSEFYRRAGKKLADELEGGPELTALANAAIERAGQPSEDGTFTRESERVIEDAEW